MPALPEIQQQFFAGIFERDTEIVDALLPSASLNAAERLGIYRGSIYGLFTTALAEIYPVCKRLLGEQFFDAMCDRYIPQHPSTSANLQDYGEAFSAFLQHFAPVAHLAFLPDVARLEWAWHNAFNAEDHVALDTERLQALNADEMSNIIFQLAPGASLLQSDHPIDQVWQANQADVTEPPQVNLSDGNVQLLIWRQGYNMRIDVLSPLQWQFLKAVQKRYSLLRIGENFPAIDLTIALPDAMGNGWLLDFSLRDNEDKHHE